jgi:hypothetical protein
VRVLAQTCAFIKNNSLIFPNSFFSKITVLQNTYGTTTFVMLTETDCFDLREYNINYVISF